MWRDIILRANCVWLVFLFGCLSNPQLKPVNEDLLLVQQKLSGSETENKALKNKIEECRQVRARLEKDIQKIDTEKKLKSQLVESQKQTIQKQTAVISLQNTVIRLFDDSEQTLQNNIKEQIKAQNLETAASSSSIKYVLENNLLFQSGSAEPSQEGKDLLMRLKDLLQDERYPYVRIEGHTDDQPLKSTVKYADNWELSAARAAAVVSFLHEEVGISPERMSAVGYGQFRPIATNETEDGRDQNRRIEIILETAPALATPVSIPDPQR
jgi:chemotaxis protein MotB